MKTKLAPQTVELLQTFLEFAQTLNVTDSSKNLRISRPTFWRRLRQLEKLCEQALVQRSGHSSYDLTAFGRLLVNDSKIWLQQGEILLSGRHGMFSALMHSSSSISGERFHVQQHPLNKVWEHSDSVLAKGLRSWAACEGSINAPEFASTHKQAIIARPYKNDFLIISIGEEAPMNEWLGQEWCRSAVGKPLSSTASSTALDALITHSYQQSLIFGTPWYDHISVELPRPEMSKNQRANYRRLVMPCTLPDGSLVIASLVELSDDIIIDGYYAQLSDTTN